MRLTVVLYGGLQREVGKRSLRIELEGDDADVRSMIDELGRQHQPIKPRLASVICAIGDELVDNDHALRDGDEISILPPVSGG